MTDDLVKKFKSIQTEIAINELKKSNEISACFGLELSDNQIENIVEKRFESLKNNGRIEFGTGIIEKLVYAFCDSPFITNENYEETLIELQDSFYYFKNETENQYSDDELISLMEKYFNSVCQGSIEYLNETSLYEIARDVRFGDADFEDNPKENR